MTIATPHAAPARTHPGAYALAVAAITLAGLGLRVVGARGELWLDEIWSAQNLGALSHVGEIFWGISQDNNHFLNSLWLWIVGPSAPPLAMRAASILLGAASIPLAARIARRAGGAAAGVAAALLFAFAYVFVHYGSEARGYAGMMLMLLWAWDGMATIAETPDDDRARLRFGIAVALGALFHVAMLPAAIALCAAGAARIAARTGSARETLEGALRIASPAFLGAAPALACIAGGILTTHKIQMGVQHPFTSAGWFEGMAALLRATLGLPEAMGDGMVVGLVCALAIAALALAAPHRRFIPVALIFLLPLAEAVARLPNPHIARFHLPVAVALGLLLSEAFGVALRRAAFGRAVACALLAALLAGSALDVARFLRLGRGGYSQGVALMGADGPATYTSNMYPETIRVVRYDAARAGLELAPGPADPCAPDGADWFVLADDNRTPPPDDASVGGLACAGMFRRAARLDYWGLSGLRWTIYRRVARGR